MQQNTSSPHGVVFPLIEGRRSTSLTGQAVVADALRLVDQVGAADASRETSWRQGYVPHFKRLLTAGLPTADAAHTIARQGLRAIHQRFSYAGTGGDIALSEAILNAPHAYTTSEVSGAGAAEDHLSVPYRGRRLAGDDLLRQLDRWIADGVAEPSFKDVIETVAANPAWLRLPEHTPVVLGATAEMGPLRSLLRWGARVAVVDLPRPALWGSLLNDVKRYAGTLLIPTREGAAQLATRAGADLIGDFAAVTTWLSTLPGRLVVGNYVYADGATNVRVSVAVDVITEHLLANRPGTALAFLATPTDVFAVPREAVAASRRAYRDAAHPQLWRRPLQLASGGRLLRPNYVLDDEPGINDSVVVQQGPNYLLAKRIQRWRATAGRANGHTVSFSVAPPTRTRSVVKNRALAAAYAGAHRFSIEVFEPATANTLMAAKLVYDLHTAPACLPHPWQDEAFAAVHGGLWRTGYDARSALGLAAVLGFAAAR